jgi:neuromedin U receptor 2
MKARVSSISSCSIPTKFELGTQISVVYATIFVVGVLGNVSTILVILKNKYMHTPTNVYLANLAISDLLTHLVGETGS